MEKQWSRLKEKKEVQTNQQAQLGMNVIPEPQCKRMCIVHWYQLRKHRQSWHGLNAAPSAVYKLAWMEGWRDGILPPGCPFIISNCPSQDYHSLANLCRFGRTNLRKSLFSTHIHTHTQSAQTHSPPICIRTHWLMCTQKMQPCRVWNLVIGTKMNYFPLLICVL